jgi:hypothetical protein
VSGAPRNIDEISMTSPKLRKINPKRYPEWLKRRKITAIVEFLKETGLTCEHKSFIKKELGL